MLFDRMTGLYKSVIYQKNCFGLKLLSSSPITASQEIEFLNCMLVPATRPSRTKDLPEVTEWVTLMVLLTYKSFS